MCVRRREPCGFSHCDTKQRVQIARPLRHHGVVMTAIVRTLNQAALESLRRGRTAACAWVTLALLMCALLGCGPAATPAATPDGRGITSASAGAGDIGFRSRALFMEHFRKHGREFGDIGPARYLKIAQELRDRPPGGDVLEIARTDGVTTRFDRRSGTFLAFDSDGTIRTCFRPRDGERYFRRQALREGKGR